MRKPIISIKLRPTDYAALINLGNRIFASMTGNVNFTMPNPALAAIQAAVTETEDTYALWAPAGSHGSKANLLDLREKALTLEQLLKAESQYVQITAQVTAGSDYVAMAAIIGSSGFQLAAAPTPQGVLQMVQGFHRFASRQLAVNQVKLKWAKPNNVTSRGNVQAYQVRRGARADFNASVEVAATTRTSFVDTNTTNTPQTWTYWIVPFNNAGPGVPSDALTITLLNA